MAGKRLLGNGRSHLAETGMGYGAHLRRATRIGTRMLSAGGACLIHGLFPGLFPTTATATIVRLNDELKAGAKHGLDEPVLLEFEI